MKIALFTLIFVLFASNSRAETGGARDYIVGVADGIFKTITDKNIPLAKQKTMLIERFSGEIDFDWNARAAAGIFWREMNDPQRKDFTQNYRDFLIRTWIPKFQGYRGESYKIPAGEYPEDPDALVPIVVKLKDGTNINIELRVRKKPEGYKVLDISAEGISMARTYNAQFTEYMSKNGIDACISYLKSPKNK